MHTDQQTYREAITELKKIVERLRTGDDVDVDDLVSDVARAKELINYCGAKVKKADAAIKEIVAELQTAERTATSPPKLPSAVGVNEAEVIPF